MKLHRFFVERLIPPCPLSDAEARHATQTLRLAAGQRVELFDGLGRRVTATLQSPAKKLWQADFAPEEVQCCPPPPVRLKLAIAPPKHDRADVLVEMASQLDAAAIEWMDCSRVVVKPDAHGHKMGKWRRLAVESAKQCGRDYVMEVLPLRPLAAIVADALARRHLVVLLHPSGRESLWDWLAAQHSTLLAARSEQPVHITALVGPEGGFSDEELGMFGPVEQGGQIDFVSICRNILRIETAGIAAAAAVSAAVNRLNMERDGYVA